MLLAGVATSFEKLGKTRLMARNVLPALILLLATVVILPCPARGGAVDHVNAVLVFRQEFEVNCTLPVWNTSDDPCNWAGISCTASGEISSIQLSGYNCSGVISEAINNITTLEDLNLSWNSITQVFPVYLQYLPRLRHLDLGINNMNGDLPPEIGNFTSLELLNLSRNNFGGDLPPELTTLKRLKYMRLGSNKFHGGLLPQFHEMLSLLEFNVSRNHLRSGIPIEFGLFRVLEILDVSRNDLRGPMPVELCNLTTLKYLDLNTNALRGPLPWQIGKLINLETLGLRNNSLEGLIPRELGNLKNMSRLFLRWNRFEGPIPEEIGDLTKLVELFLHNNLLTGPIPASFEKLTSLEQLHIGSNQLNGRIPSFLGNFKHLKLLNLSNNMLSGPIPRSLLDLCPPSGTLQELSVFQNGLSGRVPNGFQKLHNFSYIYNPDLCGDNHVYSQLGQCVGNELSTLAIVFIALGCAVAAGGLGVSICWMTACHNPLAQGLKKGSMWLPSKKPPDEHTSCEFLPDVPVFKPCGTQYTVEYLQTATRDFTEVIGRGGYGPVYKALFPDGVAAAVKVQDKKSMQGDHQFTTEIELLGRLHHKNLVNLVGYCIDDTSRMLVYEYKSNGSLHSHLHGSKAHPEQITWPMRMKIVLDVAEGLKYLHYDATPNVIHRDIKSANILLDEHFNANIADFGISRCGPTTEDCDVRTMGVTSTVKGTPGYMDPEYFYSQRLTIKSDIYSFGVLLLELLTGINPCRTDVNLPEMARNWDIQTRDFIKRIIDPKLHGEYDEDQAYRVGVVARKCVDRDVHKRPRVKLVLQLLDEHVNINTWSSTQVDTGEAPGSNLSIIKPHKGSPPDIVGKLNDQEELNEQEVDFDHDNMTVTVSETPLTELMPR